MGGTKMLLNVFRLLFVLGWTHYCSSWTYGSLKASRRPRSGQDDFAAPCGGDAISPSALFNIEIRDQKRSLLKLE